MRSWDSVGVFALLAATGACSEATVERVLPASSTDVPDARDVTAPLHDGAASESSAPMRCPSEMVDLGLACMDRFEAFVVEVDSLGVERDHSPYAPVEGLRVRARAAAKHIPQGYISQVAASRACGEAGKRRCAKSEFLRACQGQDGQRTYPYGGATKKPGVCNEGKGSSVPRLFGADSSAWTYANFNDPRLNQLSHSLAASGDYAGCVTDEGIFDLVGNLHEWGADAADTRGHGRFRGGFYGDAEVNGHGCLYVTSAHELGYHDYSIGFRCCQDAPLP
jgi:formylglycine-generating enzyme required for sulfatase activity